MIRQVAFYQIECDEPGCGFKTGDDNGEYTAWSDAGSALDDWRDGDHQTTTEGKQFCERHRKPECCGCGTTEALTQPEADGDWFCPSCLAEESPQLPETPPGARETESPTDKGQLS